MSLSRSIHLVCCVVTRVHRRKMHRGHLEAIFSAGVRSVEPRNLIRRSVRLEGDILHVVDRAHRLRKPVHVVGFGKAVLGMAIELESILGTNLERGVVTVPAGIFERFPMPDSKIRFVEGARNNLPDAEAMEGAIQVRNLVEQLADDDLLIVLVSGGGSALLPLPVHPVKLEEKLSIVKKLGERGASIIELNCVRKKLSALKGGGLARLAGRASVLGLILSDIVGDPLDFIASGPTVPNLDADGDAMDVVKKYGLWETSPDSIKETLQAHQSHEKSPQNVHNFIVGSNKIAVEAAREHAEELGYHSVVLSTKITGDVADVSKTYCELVKVILGNDKAKLAQFLRSIKLQFSDVREEDFTGLDLTRKLCVISSGEPTVLVKGSGVGGRNQELALRLSLELNGAELPNNGRPEGIFFLSGGTDGMDGPTDAAGAVGTGSLASQARERGMDPKDFVENNDSYSFYSNFDEGKYLLKIGHTGTNVMDLHIIIIDVTR